MYTIFSIDKWYDLRTLARFLRRLDEKRALGELKGDPKITIGQYLGEMEISILMATEDYNRWVKGTEYVKEQVCVLEVEEFPSFQAQLRYPDGTVEPKGELKPALPMDMQDFTYRGDIKKFFSLG